MKFREDDRKITKNTKQIKKNKDKTKFKKFINNYLSKEENQEETDVTNREKFSK